MKKLNFVGLFTMANIKNKFGQYMTPKKVANFMFSLSSANTSSRILEPSCGIWSILEVLKNEYSNYLAFEIDKR